MKKFATLINNIFRKLSHKRKVSRQSKATRQLRKDKKTDYSRWKKKEQLFEDWNERTELLASMVKPQAVVIEFGAGNMALKNYLPSGCQYTPSDIVERNSDFIKCDLNETIPFNISIYDTAVFSGVLEYVYDIDSVFKQFPLELEQVLLSYSCKDISSANRLENGWLSDYSRKELETIFAKYNYKVLNYSEWRRQSIFNLKKGNSV